MILETLLLAVAQPPAGAVATMPTCSLVTPRGDRIEFFIWGGDDPNQFNFTGVAGSSWPRRTLAGTRGEVAPGVSGFMIGGADGVSLTLGARDAGGTRRAATIIGRSERHAMLPLAYGFCDERPAPETAEPPASLSATEADSPAFNLDLWPAQDCALLLTDGRRVRFQFTDRGERDVRIQSEALWSGRPKTTPLHWRDPARASFDALNGPEGDQLYLANGWRAVKVIRFRRLGGGEPASLTGYGICGYRAVEQRPNSE